MDLGLEKTSPAEHGLNESPESLALALSRTRKAIWPETAHSRFECFIGSSYDLPCRYQVCSNLYDVCLECFLCIQFNPSIMKFFASLTLSIAPPTTGDPLSMRVHP